MKAFILFLLMPAVCGMIFCHTCADDFFLTTNDTEIRELLDSNPPFDWMGNVSWNRVPSCNDTQFFFLNGCAGHCLKYDFFDNETFIGSYRMCANNDSIVPFTHSQYIVEYERCYVEPCFNETDLYFDTKMEPSWMELHRHHLVYGVNALLGLVVLGATGYFCYKIISRKIKSRNERRELAKFLEEARRRDRMVQNVRENLLNSVASVSEYEMADQMHDDMDSQGSTLV